MIIIVLVVAGLGLGGVVMLLGNRSEPYRTTETLDARTYLENANSLRGNVYRVDAEILNSLAMSPTSGRLISVTPGEKQILPLLVPTTFNHINLQKGQHFVFMVKVDELGLLQVTQMTKS